MITYLVVEDPWRVINGGFEGCIWHSPKALERVGRTGASSVFDQGIVILLSVSDIANGNGSTGFHECTAE